MGPWAQGWSQYHPKRYPVSFPGWTFRRAHNLTLTTHDKTKVKNGFINVKIGGYLAYTPWDSAAQGTRGTTQGTGGTTQGTRGTTQGTRGYLAYTPWDTLLLAFVGEV